MKFLSKLGQIIARATAVVSGVAPLFPQYNKETGKAVDTLNGVASIVMNVEVFGQVLNTPGAEKLKAAAPLVAQILLQSDLLAKKKINNQPLFFQGAEKIAAGMADVLNSVKDSEITEESIT